MTIVIALRMYSKSLINGCIALRGTTLVIGGGPDRSAPEFLLKGARMEASFRGLRQDSRASAATSRFSGASAGIAQSGHSGNS